MTRSATHRRAGLGIALGLALFATACAGDSNTETVETGQSVAPQNEIAEVPTTAAVEAPAENASATAEPAIEAPTASADETASAPAPTADAPTPTADAAAPTADAPAPTAVPPTAVPPTAVPEPTEPPPAAVGLSLPSVDVVNLANGQTANLNSFTRPGPTLVWFWAPH